MSNQISIILVMFLIIGALSASTIYFFNRSAKPNPAGSTQSTENKNFSANLPTSTPNAQNQKVDELTKPAPPKGRLSYPSNVYTVGEKETLFMIGNKLVTPWTEIKIANGLTNENAIQAGLLLAIPKLDPSTELYRINFSVNNDLVIQNQDKLKDISDSDLYDPLKVAKKDALVYYTIKEDNEFKLVEANLSTGTSTVEVSSNNNILVVGLIQPKAKGQKGIWVIYYIEKH